MANCRKGIKSPRLILEPLVNKQFVQPGALWSWRFRDQDATLAVYCKEVWLSSHSFLLTIPEWSWLLEENNTIHREKKNMPTERALWLSVGGMIISSFISLLFVFHIFLTKNIHHWWNQKKAESVILFKISTVPQVGSSENRDRHKKASQFDPAPVNYYSLLPSMLSSLTTPWCFFYLQPWSPPFSVLLSLWGLRIWRILCAHALRLKSAVCSCSTVYRALSL